MHFLNVLLTSRRFGYLELIRGIFEELFNRETNKVIVKVSSALPLAADLQKQIRTKLEEMLHKEIEMMLEIDPRLLGGVKLTVGGDVIDGSISYKLQKLSEKVVVG